MLILGIFIFHFCGMFPYKIVPGVGHLFVGVFFMLSGFGLMESYKNKEGYLDNFIGNKTARLLVPVWIAGIIVLVIQWFVFDNYSVISNHNYLFDLISGGPGTTSTWFVVELIFFYIIFYFSFKYLKFKKAFLSVIIMVIILMAVLSYQQQAMWYGSGLMFPVGLLLSHYKNKIENARLCTTVFVSSIAAILLSCIVSIPLEPAINNLIFANLQCFLTALMIICVLILRQNNVYLWLIVLIVLNTLYYLTGIVSGHNGNLIAIMPLLSVILLLSGLNSLSWVTDFIGSISYEIYIIHGMMILVSKEFFSDIWVCLFLSLILSIFLAYIIKQISGTFFDKKKPLDLLCNASSALGYDKGFRLR